MMELIFGVIAVVAAYFAFAAHRLAVETSIELKAMQKSTHRIEYVPAESLLGGGGEAFSPRDDLDKPFTKDNPGENFDLAGAL